MAGSVVGLTLAKINGLFHVDVRNARWSDRRALNQIATGGGVVESTGFEMPSGSFDEVIPKERGFDWRALSDFTIELYDLETRSIVVASFTGVNWEGIDGNSDLGSAQSGKAISWKGTGVLKV